MMAAFGDGVGPPAGVAAEAGLAAGARRTSANVRPAPNAPMRRKLRRFRPSQKRRRSPQNVSMINPPRQDVVKVRPRPLPSARTALDRSSASYPDSGREA